MKRPQLITIGIAIVLVTVIYFFGRTVPRKSSIPADTHQPSSNDQHVISADSILTIAKKQLSAEQVVRLNTLENSISRGDVKDQQIHVYHQLARFWKDSARIFEPYAWYLAEAARLENSEKTLTFAAQLFLENLQSDEVADRRKWKALQAKDLFERSLKINPGNDSAQVGLGATYLFGEISTTPMEGILKIREVAERDTNNMYAQFMLGRASLISGQFDKAVGRLETVHRHEPGNLDAILLLAEVYERTGDKSSAIKWYRNSLSLVKQPEAKAAIEQRIKELSR